MRERDPLEGDTCDITVPPHQQYSLNFREENHFGWHGEDELYLRLSLVGRRSPLWLWVTGPCKSRGHRAMHAIKADEVS